MPDSALLGGLTPRVFLERYWQKRPLLIREAFPRFIPPLSADELAGLACEPGVESRLVIQTRKAPGWKLRQGPFRHQDFRKLPRSRWTLLVQDVDKHVPAAAALLEAFRFIPSWRIDDLMVSYAADSGSVGPHVDAYDVFLLQAEGMRRWKINTEPQEELRLPGLELKQVKPFAPQESWLLMPGDMLYLPPGVAHHGVAFGEGMTYSVGFRAPSQAEMLADFAAILREGAIDGLRYGDPDLLPTKHPGEIPAQARARARQLLRRALRPGDETLDIWFGRYVTEPKPWLRLESRRRRMSRAELKSRLNGGRHLAWHPAVRTAWFAARRTCHLFVDGAHHRLQGHNAGYGQLLGDRRRFASKDLLRAADIPELAALLLEWLDSGQMRWEA